MIVHVVLFRPRAGLAAGDLRNLVAAIERALREIPAVARFAVGKRTNLDAGYAAAMPDYPYIALVEFETSAALRGYLEHPVHEELARLFWATSDASLAYDFEVVDPAKLT